MATQKSTPDKSPKNAAPAVKIPARPTAPEKVVRRIMAPTLDDHLAVMTRAIFQAGLSWAMIAAKWDAFATAFDGFDVTRVATYGEADVGRIMEADGVIHSRAKIEGTIANAATLIALAAKYDSIEAYVARFPDYDSLWKDAHARFKHLGDLNCYYWLFRTGAPVPAFESWITRQKVDHPRVREMVLAGRADGTSTERLD